MDNSSSSSGSKRSHLMTCFLRLLKRIFICHEGDYPGKKDSDKVSSGELHYYSHVKEDQCDYGFVVQPEVSAIGRHYYEEISEQDSRAIARRRRILPLVEPYQVIPIPNMTNKMDTTPDAFNRIHPRLSDEALRHLFAEFLKEQWIRKNKEESTLMRCQPDPVGVTRTLVPEEARKYNGQHGGGTVDKLRKKPIPPARTSSTCGTRQHAGSGVMQMRRNQLTFPNNTRQDTIEV